MWELEMPLISLSANQNWRFYRGNPPGNRIDEVRKSDAKKPWDLAYNDEEWEVVCLPHTVRNEALMCSGGLNYQGPAWYRRRFRVPADTAAKDLLFELEGVMQRVDAWLDGEPLDWHEGGFLPVAFDLTGKLNPEKEHLLVLRADNSDMADVPPGKPQGALDFCYFGGLYRDAWLHVANKVRFSCAVHEGKPASGGIYVTYGKVSGEEAELRVKAHVLNHGDNDADLRIQLLLDGAIAAESGVFHIEAGSDHEETLGFTVSKPRLWHPYHPDLYTLTAGLLGGSGEELDKLSQRIGIRSLDFRPDGFYINGEKLFLGGANRHQEYAYVGFALPDALQRRDAAALRKSGVICVRTAHYPQDRAFMDACDELGVLCVVPTPGWQIHPDSVKFDLLSYEATRRLIRENRNHPSTALWEPILNETDYPEYYAKKQLEIVREELDGDGFFCACDGHYAYADHYPVNYWRGAKEGTPVFAREYGDAYIEQFGPMNTLRRVRRGENVSFYQGGERAMLRSAQERFEAYMLRLKHKGLCGAAMWAGIDHNRGYEDNEAAVGMLDFLRLPKFFYHLYTVQQNVERIGAKCFIANYWTEESPRDVTVYTNADAVRLLLNGREIGILTIREGWVNTGVLTRPGSPMDGGISIEAGEIVGDAHPPVTFKNVPWEAGELTAQALINGKTVAEHVVRTPERAAALNLVPHWEGTELWRADGADLLMVHVYALDGNGTIVPSEDREVRFSVSSGASIVGDGEAWVGANPVKLEAGASGVLLRAGTCPGEVTLYAESEGLASARITLVLAENKAVLLPGPNEAAPPEKPVYPVDNIRLFSERDSLKLHAFYRWDMASGKPATASSNAEGYPPENAAKGRVGEPWISADGQYPQWWQCDMQVPCQVYGATISWMDDGLWYEYDIELSLDGIAWTKILSNRASGQTLLPNRFPVTETARYLRINIYAVSGGNPVGIYLVEIHGVKPEKKIP
jgi:beta-galactosidase